METMADEDIIEVARLFEITSDAVAVCDTAGTVLHVNHQLLCLLSEERADVVGTDIKDHLFSEAFERAEGHVLPFELDGSESTLMLKLADGSFIPVRVRAQAIEPPPHLPKAPLFDGVRVLVAIRSLEEQYTHDRQMQRVLSELQAANKRLSGMLSVIMSTVGSENLNSLLDTVLNKLVDALDADGATILFSESGGFKLRGVSHGLLDTFVPEFIPYGAGVPTYVLRESRACRLSIVSSYEEDGIVSAAFYDLDARQTRRLRVQEMPPFKTMIAVPVFFGTQVLGIIELGWRRPCTPRVYDVRMLEVICDYLSIQLMGLMASVRSQRSAALARSLNRVRDLMYTAEGDEGRSRAARELIAEVCATLACRFCPIVFDEARGRLVIDFEGGSRMDLPGDIDELFFSTKAPAARVGVSAASRFVSPGELQESADSLKAVRLVRVDSTTWMGEWLQTHSLPSQGVFFDFGEPAHMDGQAVDAPAAFLPAPVDGRFERCFLLLRDSSQEPIDDLEYDYLVRLARDYEMLAHDVSQNIEDHRIAQALQVGMRNSLGSVPGIVTDALYSSATRSALVGGDFYTLIRLPDDQAVMILGDVSGKGIEAASMSALVKTALTAYAWEGASPDRMARSLNSMLMGFSRVETFATMFIAKIDLRRGRASYCSAGHPPTMLIHPPVLGAGADARPGEVELLSTQSGVVGAFESMGFESGSFTFQDGDMVFMYTDGAIEARDEAGEFFGEQRLRDILLARSGFGSHGLCQHVLDELDAFTGSALDDDIALVVLEFAGGKEGGLGR